MNVLMRANVLSKGHNSFPSILSFSYHLSCKVAKLSMTVVKGNGERSKEWIKKRNITMSRPCLQGHLFYVISDMDVTSHYHKCSFACKLLKMHLPFLGNGNYISCTFLLLKKKKNLERKEQHMANIQIPPLQLDFMVSCISIPLGATC